MRVVLLFGALLGSTAFAQPFWPTYSSFGPGNSFDESQYHLVGGPGSTTPKRVATQFTAEATGRLSSNSWAMSYLGGGTGRQYTVYEDEGGAIGQWLLIATFGDSDPDPHIKMFLGPGGGFNIPIHAGYKYWVELSAFDDGLSGFHYAGNGRTSRLAISTNNGGSYSYIDGAPEPAILVNVVPEPGTILAICTGLALLARRRRSLHKRN